MCMCVAYRELRQPQLERYGGERCVVIRKVTSRMSTVAKVCAYTAGAYAV